MTTICAIAKNEARYIVEWLSYHRAIGIEDIVVYDNDSSDETTPVLEKLERHGLVRRIPWPTLENRSPQITAYADFISRSKGTNAFIAFIDLDEFLSVDDGEIDIDSYLARNNLLDPSVGAIAVNQRVFGSSHLETYAPAPVIRRFTLKAEEGYTENRWFKSFARPDAVETLNSHCVKLLSGRYVDARGRPLDTNSIAGGQTPAICDGLRINHYILKSLEEYRWKQQRGGAAQATPAARLTRYTEDFFFGRGPYLNKDSWRYPAGLLEKFDATFAQLSGHLK